MKTLTRARVRVIDPRAIEEWGVPGVVLMENAGRGAAEVLMRLNPKRRPVVAIGCAAGRMASWVSGDRKSSRQSAWRARDRIRKLLPNSAMEGG